MGKPVNDAQKDASAPETHDQTGQPVAERAPNKREQLQIDREDHLAAREKLSGRRD